MDRLNITHQATRKGFNLIEAAIVLGVVGLIVGGIWSAASRFHERWKVNKFITDLSTIIRNTQDLISYQNSTAIGDNIWITKLLIDSKKFPNDWTIFGTTNDPKIKSPISNKPFLVKNYTNPTPFFAIHFNASYSNCVEIITRITALAANSGSRGNRVSGIVRPNLDGVGIAGVWNSSNFPISPNTAENGCSRADTELPANYIYISFSPTRVN